MEQDLEYYRRRSAEEARAAAAATDPRVRKVHQDFAKRYEERASGLEAESPIMHLRLVSAA